MKLSESLAKTRKDAPKDEVATNAQLLIRAGYIHKEAAGVYSYLPLGLKVLNKINSIIRAEMNSLGAQELFLTTLQDSGPWRLSERWEDKDVDIWFKTKLKNDTELGLAWSHEAAITTMLKNYLNSYRDLPQYLYQFQTKLRNETRAKSGILRTREFIMKDLYSFNRTTLEHQEFYENVKQAYLRIFTKLGLGKQTFMTVASGEPFSSDFSHEFQTICDNGEDIIYLDRTKKLAINREVYSRRVVSELGLNESKLEQVKASEVGNIFPLGTYFSAKLGLNFRDENGKEHPVVMGSYGIGPGRVMGVITEVYADDKGLVWPAQVAPAQVHLLGLGSDSKVQKAIEKLYKQLIAGGTEVIYDNRNYVSSGVKLADADLMGIPNRLIVSPKTIARGSAELTLRNTHKSRLIKLEQVAKSFKPPL